MAANGGQRPLVTFAAGGQRLSLHGNTCSRYGEYWEPVAFSIGQLGRRNSLMQIKLAGGFTFIGTGIELY